MRNHFHNKSHASGIALKKRHKTTWKMAYGHIVFVFDNCLYSAYTGKLLNRGKGREGWDDDKNACISLDREAPERCSRFSHLRCSASNFHISNLLSIFIVSWNVFFFFLLIETE